MAGFAVFMNGRFSGVHRGTSILFYLFVISVLLVRIVGALAPFFNKLDELFTIYRRVRLVTLSMVIVETVVFIVVALVK
jgi:hypothetical protein